MNWQISDTAQLLVFICMFFEDFTVEEELLSIISLKARTRGVNIFKEFEKLLNDLRVLVYKLVSIAMDGTAAITGCKNGFVALCQHESPAFLSYHCILH